MDVSMFCFVYLYPNEVGLVPDFRPLGLGFFSRLDQILEFLCT